MRRGWSSIRDEVQHRHQHQRERLGEIEGAPGNRIGENLLRLPDVGVQVGGDAARAAGQQRPRVREHDRVVVRVHHAGLGIAGLRDLMHVVRTRQAGADVEELRDARLARQVADGPAQEGPVLPHRGADRAPAFQHLAGDGPVGGEVVLAAEEVVVHARRMRPAHIDLGGTLVSPDR